MKLLSTNLYNCIYYIGLYTLITAISYFAPAFAQETARSINMTCGGTQVEIECGFDKDIAKSKKLTGRVCVNNVLSFRPENKDKLISAVPTSHDEGSTPYKLACLKGSDNKTYVSVGFIFGRPECGKCHHEEVYDVDGNRLSANSPVAEIFAEKKLHVVTDVAIENNN